MCWPSVGAGRRISDLPPACRRIGEIGTRVLPRRGWSMSTQKPRASRCGIGRHLARRLDRRAGHVRLVEQRQHLVLGARDRPGADDVVDLRPCAWPGPPCSNSPGASARSGPAQHLAHRMPVPLGGGEDRDIAVAAADRCCRAPWRARDAGCRCGRARRCRRPSPRPSPRRARSPPPRAWRPRPAGPGRCARAAPARPGCRRRDGCRRGNRRPRRRPWSAARRRRRWRW